MTCGNYDCLLNYNVYTWMSHPGVKVLQSGHSIISAELMNVFQHVFTLVKSKMCNYNTM